MPILVLFFLEAFWIRCNSFHSVSFRGFRCTLTKLLVGFLVIIRVSNAVPSYHLKEKSKRKKAATSSRKSSALDQLNLSSRRIIKSRPATSTSTSSSPPQAYQHNLPSPSPIEREAHSPVHSFSTLLLQHITVLSLRSVLLLNTARSPSRRAAAHLLQLILVSSGRRAVQALVELDDFRVHSFELGLVEVVTGGGAEAVGAAARVGRVVVVVFELGEAGSAPGSV